MKLDVFVFVTDCRCNDDDDVVVGDDDDDDDNNEEDEESNGVKQPFNKFVELTVEDDDDNRLNFEMGRKRHIILLVVEESIS